MKRVGTGLLATAAFVSVIFLAGQRGGWRDDSPLSIMQVTDEAPFVVPQKCALVITQVYSDRSYDKGPDHYSLWFNDELALGVSSRPSNEQASIMLDPGIVAGPGTVVRAHKNHSSPERFRALGRLVQWP